MASGLVSPRSSALGHDVLLLLRRRFLLLLVVLLLYLALLVHDGSPKATKNGRKLITGLVLKKR